MPGFSYRQGESQLITGGSLLPTKFHRRHSLTLQLSVLSGLAFESSTATSLDSVQVSLVTKPLKVVGVPRRQLYDICRFVVLKYKISQGRHVRYIRQSFPQNSVALLCDTFIPNTVDIQTNLLG